MTETLADRLDAHASRYADDYGYNVATDLKEAAAELRDMQQLFDLQWEADMRAVKRWREAHPGNDLVLPDRANMVVWLMEQHDARAKAEGTTP
jgi:hypothetical protein